MHWGVAFHKNRGKRLLLWCLFHPLPNNPKAPNFSVYCVFFHRLEAPQSILHQPDFWQFSFFKCKCYIWKRLESSLLPESLFLSPLSAELLLLAATHFSILLYWRDSRLSPLLSVCLFLKSQLTFGACSLAMWGSLCHPSTKHCRTIPTQHTDVHENDNNED